MFPAARRLSRRSLQRNQVEEALELIVVAEQFRVERERWNGEGHHSPPAIRSERGGAVAGLGAPVVADQNGLIVAAQRVVQANCIGDERPDPEAAIRRNLGRRISAHERRHRVITRIGQRRQQKPPGVS